MTAGLSLGTQPQGAFSATSSKTNEKIVASETLRNCNVIATRYSKGEIRWDFNIDNAHSQKKGIFMPEDCLPTVRFMFIGKSGDGEPDDEPTRPPKNMDIVITSCWKLITPSDPKSNWIRKLLDSFKPTASGDSDTQTILSQAYSNLLQIVDLNIIDLSKLSTGRPTFYQATVEFKPRTASDASAPPPGPNHNVTIDHHDALEALCVTPSVVCT